MLLKMENLLTLSSKRKDPSSISTFSINLGVLISNYHKNMTMRRQNFALKFYYFAILPFVKVFGVLVAFFMWIHFGIDSKFYSESITTTFHCMERNYRAPRITSKDFTSQIPIETISIILLVVQPEIWNANCYRLHLLCKHSEPTWSDSQGSREHLFHYLLKIQQRTLWLRVMGMWLCRRVLWWLGDYVPSKQFKPQLGS